MDNFKFFESNVTTELPIKYIDNSISILYEKIHLDNFRVYISRIVGIMHIKVPYLEEFYKRGEELLYIERLNIHNSVIMEENGMIEDILVSDGQIIMYGTPLLIVRICNH